MNNSYLYHGELITASSKKEAIHQILAFNKDRISDAVRKAYEELNERFCDYHGKIQEDELRKSIRKVIDNTQSLYYQFKNGRTKVRASVWYALEHMINDYLEWADCRKLSSEQIKNWFAYNNTDYKTALKKTIEYFEDLKKRYIEEDEG